MKDPLWRASLHDWWREMCRLRLLKPYLASAFKNAGNGSRAQFVLREDYPHAGLGRESSALGYEWHMACLTHVAGNLSLLPRTNILAEGATTLRHTQTLGTRPIVS